MADFDVVIAGAGLAGACAAFVLSRDRKVLVVEAEAPASGASGAAAGMANPLMSKRARPVWRMEAALAALETILSESAATQLIRRDGLLRRAEDAEQADAFRLVCNEWPQHASWLSPAQCVARYPEVRVPFGAIWGHTAISISISGMIEALLSAARSQGATIWTHTTLHDWKRGGVRSNPTHAVATDRTSAARHGTPDSYVRIELRRKTQGRLEPVFVDARKLLLALGRDYADFESLRRLRLHQVKGQLVRVRRPATLRSVPNLAGRGYVLVEGDSFLLGSTYEHAFCDLHPDAQRTREILADAVEMLPALEGAEVMEERAAVRVTVPGIRLPMVGPLPGQPDVWLFTGLGSKGLLMAPLIAMDLPTYLAHPDHIPREIRVRPH